MIILGLGTNLGNRKQNLDYAIEYIRSELLCVITESSIIESEPLLPESAPDDWNIKYLNMAISGKLKKEISPHEFLHKIKEIEAKLGRTESPRWSPRIIDIDILIWDDLVLYSADLQIPHIALTKRNFALKPLLEILPNWHYPTKIFGILNLTPDSFSDGGKNPTIDDAHELITQGAFAVDIGAESTRPNAETISLDEEWNRLKPFLDSTKDITISLDTRNYETAKKALNYPCVKYLNDVCGFNDQRMLEHAAQSGVEIIVMHSLTVPADKNIVLQTPVIPTLKSWMRERYEALTKAGITPEKIIFDPGIGFGKTAEQSQEIIRNAADFADFAHKLGCKILYGHSRKRFLNVPMEKRDIETAAISRYLCGANVDFIRVHNVEINQKTINGESVLN
jgi:2-amino-4-hydroxy-6-hydroxymethyldihydropteridine diphosphokinase/dihydropteroate synthase